MRFEHANPDAPRAARDAGDFDTVDDRLADVVEAMQRVDHALVQIRKQAELRVERGKTALLKGDADATAAHFATAAGFFTPLRCG